MSSHSEKRHKKHKSSSSSSSSSDSRVKIAVVKMIPGKDGRDGRDGCDGKRGKKGDKGDQGEPGNVILGYGHAVTTTDVELIIPVGGQIPFNVVDFPVNGVSVAGPNFVLNNAGTYKIDFYVRATPTDLVGPITIALTINGNVAHGGLFTSEWPLSPLSDVSKTLVVDGSVILSFPDLPHGVLTGAGSILNLVNLSSVPIIFNGDPSGVKAYLNAIRLA